MLNMSQVNNIKDLKQKGYRISEISRITGADRKTIRRYLEKDDFSPQPPVIKKTVSILDPFKPTISEWLLEDRNHWSKQHHTAKRVYERLKDEKGFTGGYSTVQRYMKSLRKISDNEQCKGTQELIWEPGDAQADFGEADFNEGLQCVRRKYLVLSFPYSNDGYIQIFGGETAECVCQGLKDIFEYIGGVPRKIVFDNATGVGRRVKEKVTEAELFKRFRAQYGFQLIFCNPEAGYEKGNVENKVGTERRNIFVPVPTYQDMEEYNKELLPKHEKKASEIHYKKGVRISELFEEDRKALLPLPRKSFNVCRYDYFKADGYGKVCIDGKHYYSTKPENHGEKVAVGIRAHYIDILNADGSVLIRHRREYGDKRTDTVDYSTSLAVLSKNAGAWMNSGVRHSIPGVLREYLDNRDKSARKATLNLMSTLTDKYGYDATVKAMEMALRNGGINESDVSILAARITGYGIDTPPEPGGGRVFVQCYGRFFHRYRSGTGPRSQIGQIEYTSLYLAGGNHPAGHAFGPLAQPLCRECKVGLLRRRKFGGDHQTQRPYSGNRHR